MSVPTVERSATTRDTWQIDPSHTSVEFSVKHMVVTTVKGLFGKVAGSFELDEANLERSSVYIEIEAASIDTRWPDRDAHLRSADFLDAEQHPTLTFRSRRVVPRSADRFELIGDLTIRGITREVSLEVEYSGQSKDPWGGTRAGFSAAGVIDRTDWNMTWNGALEAGGLLVSNQVKIQLDVEAIKQAD
jgi:polyisoprenoid-binding protein YceI